MCCSCVLFAPSLLDFSTPLFLLTRGDRCFPAFLLPSRPLSALLTLASRRCSTFDFSDRGNSIAPETFSRFRVCFSPPVLGQRAPPPVVGRGIPEHCSAGILNFLFVYCPFFVFATRLLVPIESQPAVPGKVSRSGGSFVRDH